MHIMFSSKLRIMLLTVSALALACGNAMAGWTFTDLNAMGGLEGSYALGINNNGDVVGQASFAGAASPTAALWSNGVVSNLGTLGGNPAMPQTSTIMGSWWGGRIPLLITSCRPSSGTAAMACRPCPP